MHLQGRPLDLKMHKKSILDIRNIWEAALFGSCFIQCFPSWLLTMINDDKPLPTMINHDKPLLATINHYQLRLTITNHYYQPLLSIISHWLLTITIINIY